MEIILAIGVIAALTFWAVSRAGVSRHRLWLQAQHQEWQGQLDGQPLRLILTGEEWVLVVNGVEVLRAPIETQSLRTTKGVRIHCELSTRIEGDSEEEWSESDSHEDSSEENVDVQPTQSVTLSGAHIRLQTPGTFRDSWREEQAISEVTLFINDRLIPLKLHSDAPTSPVQAQQVGRWNGAQALLGQIQETFAGDPAILSAAEQLGAELKSLFSLLAELDSPDVGAVWTKEEQEHCRAALEKDIEAALDSVQELHQLSLQQRQSQATGAELCNVEQTIAEVSARLEVQELDGELKRRLKQRVAEQRRTTEG